MLLEIQALWKPTHWLECERMAGKHEGIAAEWDQWDADCAEPTEWNTIVPRAMSNKMVDPVCYCSSAKELDRFLAVLWLNFKYYPHLFPSGGPDHGKYAISLVDAWSNCQNTTHKQKAMTDPTEWPGVLWSNSDPCLQELDHSSQEIAKVYGDTNQRHVAVITQMQWYINIPQESVRVYLNCLKPHLWQAGLNRQKCEEVLSGIAWAGLHTSSKHNVGPTTPVCSRFDTVDEFFDKATASEVTHVENNNWQQQQHQQQQQQQQK